MTTLNDPKDLIDQANNLLDDINQANLKFVDKTNQITTAINQNFRAVDKLNQELEKEEFEALESMDGEMLDYLAKSD